MNKIEKAFGNIKADDALKEATFEKVAAQMRTRPEKSKVVKQRKNARRFAAVAAVLVVALVFAGGGYQVYAKPVSYITMNVNPSVELGINRWDKVVECTGLNADGSELLDRVDVKGLNYKNAMEELIGDEQIQSCINKGDEFAFSVTSENDSMANEVERICSGHGMKYHCNREGNGTGEHHGQNSEINSNGGNGQNGGHGHRHGR